MSTGKPLTLDDIMAIQNNGKRRRFLKKYHKAQATPHKQTSGQGSAIRMASKMEAQRKRREMRLIARRKRELNPENFARWFFSFQARSLDEKGNPRPLPIKAGKVRTPLECRRSELE